MYTMIELGEALFQTPPSTPSFDFVCKTNNRPEDGKIWLCAEQ
jgi:hypothetical protein